MQRKRLLIGTETAASPSQPASPSQEAAPTQEAPSSSTSKIVRRSAVIVFLFGAVAGLWTGFLQQIGAYIFAHLVAPWLPHFWAWVMQSAPTPHLWVLAPGVALVVAVAAAIITIRMLRSSNATKLDQSLASAHATFDQGLGVVRNKFDVLAEMTRQLDQYDSSLAQAVFALYHRDHTDVSTVLGRLLEQIIRMFSDLSDNSIFRGFVFVPDDVNLATARFLIQCAQHPHGVADEGHTFYIGPAVAAPTDESYRSGIAGKVFRSDHHHPEIVHFDEHTGKPDNDDFCEFPSGNPPYWRSMLVLPIRKDPSDKASKVYGILSLDSSDRNRFDDDPALSTLAPILLRIGHVLDLREKILADTVTAGAPGGPSP